MNRKRATLLALFLVASGLVVNARTALAQSASDLQSQIDQHNSQISQLEADIAQYQTQLDALGKQKNTLQGAISQLTLSQKQLAAQIAITQNKIAAATLQITQLTNQIGDKQETIAADQSAIARALRDAAESEDTPVIQQLFSADNLTQVWQIADQTLQFDQALENDVKDLQLAQATLSSNRDEVAGKKKDLQTLSAQLATQKRSVDASKAAQQSLLAQTNNQESSYQKLIAQKKASELAFEQELINLQSQLNLVVNPGSLPKVGSGVLAWPYSVAYMQQCARRSSLFGNPFCITQYFGNTPFSTANPQIYSGHGHDGIDIAANIGTPVLAALGGVVLGTGNTDVVRGCYSFGKWVMIKHPNGINTMYAHLSQIEVSSGQVVTQGQEIGLSGETGYATGPHLHFGVYATDGTEIMTLRQFRGATIGCADATMPVATLTAYLNPLSYL